MVLNTDNDDARRSVEICYRTNKTLVNPIIDWSDDDVWEFLKSQNCKSNPLYYQGFKRVGCVGCPMAGGKGMKKEFGLYPRYAKIYKRVFGEILKANEKSGRANKLGLTSGEQVFRWWVGDDPKQITMEDYMNEINEEW